MLDILFTVLVFGAMMAVLLDIHAEIVLAITLLCATWLTVQFFTPSLMLAIFLILLAAFFRLTASLLFRLAGSEIPWDPVPIIDELLTDRNSPPEDEQHRRQLQPDQTNSTRQPRGLTRGDDHDR
jgi:hypothetical protein